MPLAETEKYGIYQSQLSMAWCLTFPLGLQDTMWFNTFEEARKFFVWYITYEHRGPPIVR